MVKTATELKVKPKNDLAFKKIFGDEKNVDLLIHFLSCVLDIPINEIYEITIIEGEITPETSEKKYGHLDILLKCSQGIINIEMQLINTGFFKERSLFYWAKEFAVQLDKGTDYSKLQKTIAINIVDFDLFDCEYPHSTFTLLETERHEQLTDKIRIDFLELHKANKARNKSLKEWLDFFNATTEEELNMIAENTADKDIFAKAIDAVYKMSADEALMREINAREKAIRDEISAIRYATEQGIEKGRAEGMEKGIEKGKAEGINELMKKWKNKGYTDKQIQELLS